MCDFVHRKNVPPRLAPPDPRGLAPGLVGRSLASSLLILDRANGAGPAGLGVHLGHLVRLHAELALAEVRRPLATAAAAGVLALMASTTASVALIAAAVAPFFGAPWPHLAIAGSAALVLRPWPWSGARGDCAGSRCPSRP